MVHNSKKLRSDYLSNETVDVLAANIGNCFVDQHKKIINNVIALGKRIALIIT